MKSLEMESEIRKSKVKNFSTQLSTEASYHLGCSFRFKEANDPEALEENINLFSGTYLCGINTDYGSSSSSLSRSSSKKEPSS